MEPEVTPEYTALAETLLYRQGCRGNNNCFFGVSVLNCNFFYRAVTYCSVLLVLAVPGFALAANLSSNKLALVIGNGGYNYAEHLPNPANDARELGKQLRRLGFNVLEGVDLSNRNMGELLEKFVNKINKKTIALFYYAGHGMQQNGTNYLIPVNANIKAGYKIEDTSLDLNKIIASINLANPVLSIILVDACRDNPFAKRMRNALPSKTVSRKGLAEIDSTTGTILSYATEPGKTADDGYDKHSPYTQALLKYINIPGLSLQDMLNRVGLEVMEKTNGAQKPWLASSPIPRFCFAGCDAHYSESAAIVNSLQSAIAEQDIGRIKKIVILNNEQEALFQGLFTVYSELIVDVLVPSDTSSSGKQKNVILNIKEATNHGGNRVLPSEQWKYITLFLK